MSRHGRAADRSGRFARSAATPARVVDDATVVRRCLRRGRGRLKEVLCPGIVGRPAPVPAPVSLQDGLVGRECQGPGGAGSLLVRPDRASGPGSTTSSSGSCGAQSDGDAAAGAHRHAVSASSDGAGRVRVRQPGPTRDSRSPHCAVGAISTGRVAAPHRDPHEARRSRPHAPDNVGIAAEKAEQLTSAAPSTTRRKGLLYCATHLPTRARPHERRRCTTRSPR
jgi:hypothetical protein